MWTCCRCNAEVEDNFEVCWSCGTAVDGSQDPTFRPFTADEEVPSDAAENATVTAGKPVTVASYGVAKQVQEVQALLEAEGIGVFIAYEFADTVGNIHVQVAEADVEQARKVLLDHADKTTPLPPAPPKPPEPTEEEKYKDEPWKAPVPRNLSTLEVLHFLEGQLSALIDSKDTPDWRVNPAYHPDVIAWVQQHANNTGFVQKAQKMQQNRAKYFATIRQQQLNPKPKEEEPVKEAEPARPSALAGLGRTLKLWLIVWPLRLVWRLFKVVFLLLMVLGLVGVCGGVLYRGYGDKQLEEAINEADEKSPEGWTWNSLQMNRKKIEDEDNAALVVEAVAKKLPEDWEKQVYQLLVHIIGDIKAHELLGPEQVKGIQEELDKRQEALLLARSLDQYWEGRWPPLTLKEVGPGEPRPGRVCRLLADLLRLDVLLLTHEQKAEKALRSARAILIMGRAVGDDPDGIHQMCRLANQAMASRSVHRVLAQCTTAAEAELSLTQRLFEDEAQQPTLLWSLRGLRACYDMDWKEAEAGNMQAFRYLVENKDDLVLYAQDTPAAQVELILRAGMFKSAKANYLRKLTEAVEIARLPADQQPANFATYQGPPNVVSFVQSFQGSTARLRCTTAMLACERYRLARNRWPNTWEQLVPNYLAAVPLDPFDGKPLRIKTLSDGLIVYSIGKDRTDDGGHMVLEKGDMVAHPKDIGFRLWDPQHRNQPPKPNE